MARLPRFVLPGEPQHVIQRGNNKDNVFVRDDDYLFYLRKLEDACAEHDTRIHAYVLMTNHVHFLMTPLKTDGISKVMQSLGRAYVRYFNDLYGRTGTLWEGRYRATLVDSEAYLLTCYRYIELNPVRAGMVEHPADYPWSSFRYNALGQKDSLITPHDLYLRLGTGEESRRDNYTRLFGTRIPAATLEEIRMATNKAWVLGDDGFRQRIESLIDRRTAPRPRGGDRKSSGFRDKARINRV
jgi:putative transposase